MNASAKFSDDTSSLSGFPTIPLVVILGVLSCAIVLGNSLVCYAVYSRRGLHSVTYFPIVSLAIADLLVGLVAMPSYMMKKLMTGGQPGAVVVCDLFRFSYFVSGYASILSLCIISIERLIVIRSPLTSAYIVTPRRVTLALLFVWLDALVISALPFFPWPGNESGECHFRPTRWWSIMVIATNVITPFLFIVTCYVCIYGIAKSHARKIRDERRSVRNAHNSRNSKANRTVMIVIGVFIISWFPSSVYYFLQGICPACFPDSFNSVRSLVNALVKLLTFNSSLFNPVIYCWRDREFRQAFKLLFCRKRLTSNAACGTNVQSKGNLTPAASPSSH